jgi:hypothetical protein
MFQRDEDLVEAVSHCRSRRKRQNRRGVES